MRGEKLALASIVCGAILRLVFWMTSPVTGDACFHYSIARHIAQTYSIPTFEYVTGPNPFWWPPLFHTTTAVIYKATGVLTASPLLYGIAGLIVFNAYLKRFYPSELSTASLILAFLPFHVYYSSIGYFETLIFMMSLLAFYFYQKYLEERGHRSLMTSACVSGLTTLIHYHGFVPMLAITAHLIITERKKAPVFFAIGLLIASPWYLRNYAVFGNPIWPKLYGGYYPEDKAVQSVPLGEALTGLLSPGRWGGVFFDFWIGAPNSGEDFADNVEVGRNKYPLFTPIMGLWVVAILGASLLAVKGLYGMRSDKHRLFIALVFLISLGPFMVNNLARMFVSFIPFIVIALARGFNSLKLARKQALLYCAVLLLAGGSYSYSYTYKSIVNDYLPFYGQMKARIHPDSKVIMPFNIQDCVYYTGRRCQRIGSTGGVPLINMDNIRQVITDHDIKYICCSTLHWEALPEREKLICESYSESIPFIDYASDSVWGRCWDARKGG